MSRKRQHSNSNPPGPSTSALGSSGPNATDNRAIRSLKSALKILQGGLEVFPPLKNAVDEIVECTKDLQISDHQSEEYKDLAADLAALARSLYARLSQLKPTHTPFSFENVARAIVEQSRDIQQHRDRLRTRPFAAAQEGEDNILRCYRRVMALFQQLQMDISLCVWDDVREQKMNTHLKNLLPAHDACYNSALPAAMTKRRECTPNTRMKVLADAQAWTQEGEAKIYWMNGMAGTGKTTIAYSLCKRLEEAKQLGASFFCSRDSPSCRDVNRIVPTIAYQLARYSNPYRQTLCEALNNNPDIAKRDIKAQFKNLMVEPLGIIKETMPVDVVVVVDALDECEDIDGTEQVLDLLFHHAAGLPIKFFVTSRPEPSISDRIIPHDDTSRSILHLHNIERSLVEADIKTYLLEALSSVQFSIAEIDQLATQAGSLFIFAATAVRYILPIGVRVNYKQRLETVLGLCPNPSNKRYKDIDGLYSAILSNALDETTLEEPELETRKQVLCAVVCAKEPLTVAAIAEVLGLVDNQDVQLAIQPLQSVLHVSDSSRVVSTLHASFPDFLLNKERAGPLLYCDEAEYNAHLAVRCFEVMKQALRFNICQIETSYLFDEDVPNLQARVDSVISSGLFYVCRYWGDHLLGVPTSQMSTSLLEEFLQNRLLFWMEVLGLKGWIHHGDGVLSQALRWLPTDGATTELQEFIKDARNFVTSFAANPTSLSTPHIYVSVLPFTPKQSRVWKSYWRKMQGLLQVEGTVLEARGRAALATWHVGAEIASMAQSGDSKRIVVGCDDDTVSIWDLSTGARIVGPLQSGQPEEWCLDELYRDYSFGPHVAFSFDGTHIASGSRDCLIRVWDSRNGALITNPLSGHLDPVLAIAFSPDGSSLISGSEDCTIRIWNVRDGAPASAVLDGHQGAILSVALSPDGNRIASGSSDNTIRVWDPHTGTTIVGPLRGHTDSVQSVAFSPDGQRLVSGSDDKTVRVWDLQSGTIVADPFTGHTFWVRSVAFSPDGVRIVSGSSDGTFRIWDAQNGALLAEPLEGPQDSINSVHVLFSVDGTRIFSGSDDDTVCVWDARHGTTATAESTGHTDTIYSVAFSPDGMRAVSGSADHTIRVWDTRNGRLVLGPLEGHAGDVCSVSFSPDGAQILSGSDGDGIRTWDARSGAPVAGPLEGHTSLVWSVAYSPDGRRIVSGSDDGTIRMWDSQTGETVAEPFMGHTDYALSVAWSPDGTRIASGSSDNTIRMWNAQDGTALWMSDAHTGDVNCVAFSPDGGRVASGSFDRTILVLNADDGTVLYGPFKGHTHPIFSVAFSPDGTRIVSGSWDDTVCVWDAQKGTLVSSPFKGHHYVVQSVAFSPDGRRVISCSDDWTIRLWDVATADNPLPAYFNNCTLRDDGWVVHSDSQLLMWLPPDLREVWLGTCTDLDPFPLPPCSGIIGPEATILTSYHDLLIGERWNECYCDSTTCMPP